jgi:signal transduction histidine kinase
MDLRRLKIVSVLAPLLFLAALEVVRLAMGPGRLDNWPGYALLAVALLLGVVAFAHAIFGIVEGLHRRLVQQNRELLALHEAGLGIAGELGLDAVLQKVVDQARELAGARYGALSVPGPDGAIQAFITSGITAEERARLGAPPVGHGLLGVVLREGEHLRLRDLTRDPRASGFPPGHPPMRSLLAVPITSGGAILGNLYLAEKQGGAAFTADDEETLERFATQAALAIENARLHDRVQALAINQERGRIAREMHDSLAQVLGYVNTKVQAVQELVRTGELDRAERQLEQLREAAQSAYADVRQNVLSLRSAAVDGRGLGESLAEYLELWQEQNEIETRLTLEPPGSGLAALPATAELQLVRIIQEALANVRKHAGARRIDVTIRERPGMVEAEVEDDGRGFDPANLGSAQFPRFGLATMRERAESVGGTLEVVSAPAEGTRVLVRIPTVALPLEGEPTDARTHR